MEISKSYISQESVDAAIDFADDFVARLDEFPNRLTATEQETACARAIRSRLADETDVNARLEAFKATPRLGRAAYPALGGWFALCHALYYLSFAGNKIVQILLTVFALAAYFAGNAVIVALVLNNGRAGAILKKKVSYNVVSEYSKCSAVGKERTVVIADNHDAKVGSVFKDNDKFKRFALVVTPLAAVVFVLFCVIKMAVGVDTTAKISALAVLPAPTGVLGTIAMLFLYSPLARHAKQNGGYATCIAMATYAYFAEQPDLLPDDMCIVYASFGGENSGRGGSAAFIKAHPEFASAYVLCIGDVEGDSPKIADYDPLCRMQFSTAVTSAISAAAHEQELAISTVPHATLRQKLSRLNGFLSSGFAKANMSSATLLAMGDGEVTEDTLKQMFRLSVSAVFKLFKEIPPVKEEVEKASSAPEFKSIFSK